MGKAKYPPPRKRDTPRSSSVLVRDVKVEDRNRFKAWCAERGLSMNEVLTAFMSAAADGRVKGIQKWI